MMTIISMLLIVIIVALILFMTGHPDLAWLVGNFAPLLIMFGALAFIVLMDSKKRWPNSTAAQRLIKVMTFKR